MPDANESRSADREPIDPAAFVADLTDSSKRYPVTSAIGGAAEIHLHLNESAFPPSPKAIEGATTALLTANRYPAPQHRDLVSALAAPYGLSHRQFFLGGGTDELVQYLVQAFAAPGTVVVGVEPTFPKYAQSAALTGSEWRAAPLGKNGQIEIETLLGLVPVDDPAILFVASPNNPTGGILTDRDFSTLAQHCPTRTLVVIDDAYGEYAREEDYPDILLALKRTDLDWAVLRTFSKAYGLAGLRIGYGIAGRAGVAEAVRRVTPVFTLSAPAIHGALAALGDVEYMKDTVRRTIEERRRIKECLVCLGLTCLSSHANFLAVDLRRPAAQVIGDLLREGIRVAGIPGKRYATFIRMTVGDRTNNDRFLGALEKILEMEPAG